MTSNPAPDPKKFHNSAGSDSKNPDPEQHCAEVTDTATSGIKESVSLQTKASDKTNGLGEGNSAKEIIVKNIVSLATQLSQNQNKIFPGKAIVYIFIPESFVLPSVY